MKIEFLKLQAEIDDFAWNFKISNHVDEWSEEERDRLLASLVNSGNHDAQVFLAHSFLKAFHGFNAQKQFLEPDYKSAALWANKAAIAGCPMGWAILFMLYFKGLGVAKDRVKAAKCLLRLAEKGNPEAQTLLGECCYLGQGVKESHVEALKWFLKAADKEYYRAEFNIGELYELGHGVPPDRNEASKWKKQSFEHGSKYPYPPRLPLQSSGF